MKYCICQWFLFVISVSMSAFLGWPIALAYVSGGLFGAAIVMTAVTIQEARK